MFKYCLGFLSIMLIGFSGFILNAQIFIPFAFWREKCSAGTTPVVVTFTTDGVFKLPKGCTNLTVKAWGGGGGGGAANNAGTGGGGGTTKVIRDSGSVNLVEAGGGGGGGEGGNGHAGGSSVGGTVVNDATPAAAGLLLFMINVCRKWTYQNVFSKNIYLIVT